MQIIRTILADNQSIFIEGLKAVLQRSDKYRFDIVGIAGNGEELLYLLRRKPADLLVLDLNLTGNDGLEILEHIAAERIALHILVLTIYAEPKIVKSALKHGAGAYILKSHAMTELFPAIEALRQHCTYLGEGVHPSGHEQPQGLVGRQQTDRHAEDRFLKKYDLTKRELEVLRLITRALSNKEIARELYISDQTVSVHRKNIMRKLGVSNAAGLIRAAYDYSLV